MNWKCRKERSEGAVWWEDAAMFSRKACTVFTKHQRLHGSSGLNSFKGLEFSTTRKCKMSTYVVGISSNLILTSHR